MKRLIAMLLCAVLCVSLLAGCSLWGEKKIGKDAALQAALTDAALERTQVVDVGVEFEKDRYNAWYEVEFESGLKEYEYKIDAYTGEILASKTA